MSSLSVPSVKCTFSASPARLYSIKEPRDSAKKETVGYSKRGKVEKFKVTEAQVRLYLNGKDECNTSSSESPLTRAKAVEKRNRHDILKNETFRLDFEEVSPQGKKATRICGDKKLEESFLDLPEVAHPLLEECCESPIRPCPAKGKAPAAEDQMLAISKTLESQILAKQENIANLGKPMFNTFGKFKQQNKQRALHRPEKPTAKETTLTPFPPTSPLADASASAPASAKDHPSQPKRKAVSRKRTAKRKAKRRNKPKGT